MSLGTNASIFGERTFKDAVAYARKNNVIIVAAAGNNARDASRRVPAGLQDVIAVSALDRYLNRASFSNRINNTTYGIAAPGTSIISAHKNNSYATLDGTSMATPHVSGLIAVMKAIDPNLDLPTIHAILHTTGKVVPETKETGRMIQPYPAILQTLSNMQLASEG